MAIAEGPSAGPLTATGTDPRNVDGQAICITVFSTVKGWGRLWLPLVFLYARLVPSAHGTLARLSFIHFARWTLVKELPEQRLRHPHLFFESNFNGGWEEYIDAFSHILTRGMTLFWGSSYGFPTPLPTGRFKNYIKRHEIVASHFYSAYPDATTTIVLSALELDAKLRDFRSAHEGHGSRGLRATPGARSSPTSRGTCERPIPTARARPARSPSSRRSRPAPSRRCASTWRGCARRRARWPACSARTSAAGSSSPTSCPTTSPGPIA